MLNWNEVKLRKHIKDANAIDLAGGKKKTIMAIDGFQHRGGEVSQN